MRVLAVATLALGACFSPNPPLGVPCTSMHDCPAGQQCDLVNNVCTLPTEVVAWRDDTAADFAAGTYLDEVTIDPGGFLGPAAYFTGGVRLTAIPGAFTDENAATFDGLVAQTAAGTGLAHGLHVDYGAAIPAGLGLTSGDDVTIAFEGEVELDAAGTWRFQLTANDRGFVEIAPPGSTTFQRVVADANAGTIGTFDVTTPGWHRIRGAFADAAQNMSLDLRVDAPNVAGAGFRAIASDRIRAYVGDMQGLLVDGFEEAFAVGYVGSFVSTMSLANQTYGTDPYGLALGTAAYTLRWSGQILIDVDGDYAFKIDSAQGHRAFLDGVQVADRMTSEPETTVTTPMHLVPGWHDLVVDAHKDGGPEGASLSVTVDSGPAMVGESFAPDHVRPVIGRVARIAAGTGAAIAIPDGAAATRTFGIDVPAGFQARRVDAHVEVDHPVLTSLEVVLDPPVGSNITMAAFGTMTGAGTTSRHVAPPAGDAGSTWSFIATDNAADMMTGSITTCSVSILGDGGRAPFATSYRYDSAVHDLGDVAALSAMTWTMRQAPEGQTATVRLRTCDAAEACAGAPWTEVALGAVPAVPLRRFAQYEVEIATNGDVPTALDAIELRYSAYVHE